VSSATASTLLPPDRRTAIRWVIGWVLVPLGGLILAGSLDQIVDPAEPPELFHRALIALVAGVGVGVMAAVVVGLGFAITRDRDARRALRWVAVLTLTPTGIGISTSASLALSGVAVALTGAAGPALVTFSGFAMLALGRWLARGFWGAAWSVVRFAFQRAVGAMTSPAASTGQPGTGTASTPQP
jgi:hypothetical protein